VTGATSGIGRASVERLRNAGHHVHAVGRADADLSEPDAVRSLAGSLMSDARPPDTVIHTAAVSNPSLRLSRSGVDGTLAVNHLAPVLLTRLLAPTLGRRGRVLLIGSSQHRRIHSFDPAVFDPASESSAVERYEMTKVLTLLHLADVAASPLGDRFTIAGVDPGFVRTGLGRRATGAFRVLLAMTRPIQSRPEVPAELLASLVESDQLTDGAYLSNAGNASRSALSRDPIAVAAARSWTEEQLTAWDASPAPVE
jgi:NAD(P)-dependent dehydrogenase (short-subunit alcohol dehydrogenase family)